MDNNIKKYKQFLNENKLINETEVRDFLKTEVKNSLNTILDNTIDRFPIKNIGKTDLIDLNKIKGELVEEFINIIINNTENFDKTWISNKDKFDENDTVYDIDTEEEYLISYFNTSKTKFFDKGKNMFIPIDKVYKK